MIKNRSFLFGLGSGLISGALLLQLMISGGAVPLTKEQVLEGAERLNLTLSESPEVTTPAEPLITASPSPVVSPEEPNNTDIASPPAKPTVPSSPTESGVELPKVSTAPSTVVPKIQEVTQKGMISVHIPNGSTLNETADILADAGAIKDKNLFLKTAMERKVNKIIKYGTYSFEQDEKIDTIIDKLITLK